MRKITFIASVILMLAACQKAEQIISLLQTISPEQTFTKSPIFNIDNASNFSIYANAGKLLVVYFWASWCGPCKMYTPIFNEVAAGYTAEKCLFGKVDYDTAGDLAISYGIKSLPTTIFIKDMSEVARLTGACSKTLLVTAIEEYL